MDILVCAQGCGTQDVAVSVLLGKADGEFVHSNLSLHLQAQRLFLTLNNMLLWNIMEGKKDGLVPKLYTVLLGLSYFSYG